MKKHVMKLGTATTVILLILLILSGYASLWFVAYASNGNAANSIIIQLAAIGIIMLVAYGILKAVFHIARLKNRNQSELKLKDLPKNAEHTDIGHQS